MLLSEKNGMSSAQSPQNTTTVMPHISSAAEHKSAGYQSILQESEYSLSSQNQLKRPRLPGHRNTFERRHQSQITTPHTLGTIGGGVIEEERIGNFGHPVHLACPKNFTLTPVDKLEPMGYDMNLLPLDMRITSNKDETDVPKVR